jgi:hypothetical protein
VEDTKIVKKTLIALTIGSLAGFAAFGQDTAKDDLKKSGRQDVKKAGRPRARRQERRQGRGKRHKEGRP